MRWHVLFHEEFALEFDGFPKRVQEKILARAESLKAIGPNLGRPDVDTLKGSRYVNMKELRFSVNNGVWRIAFAFDPNRQAVLLVAGDKLGIKEKRFYSQLISKADQRFNSHLSKLEEAGG
ncbi:hypothetical protein Pse7367_0114 [Thalassoporum mexicanum PCC 7367]|uniref:type II toxin-antitoxin system RelE/ParE family toxin n=1 Tax=Thalassoporum mexicanum TaxID=3457544 RepID=UPI00029FFFBC|nr:type II toxin-antitoxin system RelE/ParE family toxin [Pseudanabaena sp. PCC 7367]AFY68432.1 hypothetical protein Pse7367_0114 [Pseudanabaena sp. PCC 7367]